METRALQCDHHRGTSIAPSDGLQHSFMHLPQGNPQSLSTDTPHTEPHVTLSSLMILLHTHVTVLLAMMACVLSLRLMSPFILGLPLCLWQLTPTDCSLEECSHVTSEWDDIIA